MNIKELHSRSENEVFSDLEELCSSDGYIHVLAYISYRDNLITFKDDLTDDDVADSYADGRTIRTEFSTLMGLSIKHPISFDVPAPKKFQSLIDRTTELLSELHECLGQPMLRRMAEAFKASQDEKSTNEQKHPFLHGDVLREPIFYGGESAYNFQYRDFAALRYTADNDWLEHNKGFRIEDAQKIASAIARLPVQKYPHAREKIKSLHPDEWTFLPLFTFNLEEIASSANVSKERAEKVLEAFTIDKIPSNGQFNSLSDFNFANAFPLIRSAQQDYISLQS